MFCPRCGHQPVSNELRFCSYCGFKLGVVKASLADEEETKASTPSASNAPTISTPPRHRNINIGVILMFLGALLAMVISVRSGNISREGGGLILSLFYVSILLFSSHIIKAIYKLLSWGEQSVDRLSTSRREVGFGATLMFLSTVISAIISFLIAGRMKTSTFPLAVLVSFAMLLVISPYLLHALRYLIRGESNVTAVPNLITDRLPYERALPSAREFQTALVDASRSTTAEIRLPAQSVTEHTTDLLSEK